MGRDRLRRIGSSSWDGIVVVGWDRSHGMESVWGMVGWDSLHGMRSSSWDGIGVLETLLTAGLVIESGTTRANRVYRPRVQA